MTNTRNHDQIDDAHLSAPSSKRARRSSSTEQEEPEPEPDPEPEPVHVIEGEGEGEPRSSSPQIPPPTSLAIHLSTPAPAATEGAKDNFDAASDSSNQSEHSSHHKRIPSGIEGYDFPDTYAPSSPTPSQSGRVPSGIEGYYFPEYYGSEPGESTMVSHPEVVKPEEAIIALEKQYHFHDNRDAINRGNAVISAARAIINGTRFSPSAKDKVLPLIEAAKKKPVLGEAEFATAVLAILIDEARMVLKAGVVPGKALSPDDYEAKPRAWTEDYLGTRVQPHFRADSIPQAVAADGSFEKIFNYYPRLQTPRPDLLFGLSKQLLPANYCTVIENVETDPLTKGIHHPFLAGELKTRDRPIAEAQIQCQRTGSAIVAYNVDWIAEANGQDRPKVVSPLLTVDEETESSSPDLETFCFSVAIAPNCCFLYVNWRETWTKGAIYWHTNILDQYSLEYGLMPSVERFHTHIRNILTWGLGERAEKIYEQTRALSKRKSDTDLPVLKPKKQRTDGNDSSSESE